MELQGLQSKRVMEVHLNSLDFVSGTIYYSSVIFYFRVFPFPFYSSLVVLYSISTPPTLVIGIKACCTSNQRCLKTTLPGPTHTTGFSQSYQELLWKVLGLNYEQEWRPATLTLKQKVIFVTHKGPVFIALLTISLLSWYVHMWISSSFYWQFVVTTP